MFDPSIVLFLLNLCPIKDADLHIPKNYYNNPKVRTNAEEMASSTDLGQTLGVV